MTEIVVTFKKSVVLFINFSGLLRHTGLCRDYGMTGANPNISHPTVDVLAGVHVVQPYPNWRRRSHQPRLELRTAIHLLPVMIGTQAPILPGRCSSVNVNGLTRQGNRAMEKCGRIRVPRRRSPDEVDEVAEPTPDYLALPDPRRETNHLTVSF